MDQIPAAFVVGFRLKMLDSSVYLVKRNALIFKDQNSESALVLTISNDFNCQFLCLTELHPIFAMGLNRKAT